jgi:hypothetical protein
VRAVPFSGRRAAASAVWQREWRSRAFASAGHRSRPRCAGSVFEHDFLLRWVSMAEYCDVLRCEVVAPCRYPNDCEISYLQNQQNPLQTLAALQPEEHPS